jgi:hypothetical protein
LQTSGKGRLQRESGTETSLIDAANLSRLHDISRIKNPQIIEGTASLGNNARAVLFQQRKLDDD